MTFGPHNTDEDQRRELHNEVMEAEAVSESGREVRMRHEEARAEENRKGDRVEPANREAGRPERQESGCSPGGDAAFAPPLYLTYKEIRREINNVLGMESNAVEATEWIMSNLHELARVKARDRAATVSTGPLQASPGAGVRSFPTGATRSSSEGKPDYEGYLSPLVIERFGRFMLKHQYQPDGTRRPSDNWQKGMPVAEYFKSMFRHFVSAWKKHRGWDQDAEQWNLEEDLCAVIFNASGALHEIMKKRVRG